MPAATFTALLLTAATPATMPTLFQQERNGETLFGMRGTTREIVLLRRKLRRCGTPSVRNLADGRAEISISLKADDDYVVVDCISHQFGPVRTVRRRPGAND
jgi:hypothetical protein